MKVFEKTNRIFLLMLMGCLSFSLTPTASGFITDAHRLVNSNLLISKVHEPSWKIGYRYGAECKPKDRQDKVLEETITRALQAWLTPLRELQPDRPITNNFTFHLQEDFHGDTDENLEGRWAVDVRITFRCARVSSFALIGSGDAPPDIFVHWGDEENDTLSDLTHELGHAFGLADTYLHRGIRSTGGLPGTVGTQPSSAMSFYFRQDQIGEDDKRGIIWFYKHFYEGLELEDCFFPDYVLEKEPRGCRPKHPLIFEVKHGRRTFVLKLLNKAPTIDVNAQDAAGMTALHHAAALARKEVVQRLLEHQNIKPALKDTQGRTALDIAYAAELIDIIKLLEVLDTQRSVEDVNADGVVNILDLVVVASNFGQTGKSRADVNGDGVVDIRDLVTVASVLQ